MDRLIRAFVEPPDRDEPVVRGTRPGRPMDGLVRAFVEPPDPDDGDTAWIEPVAPRPPSIAVLSAPSDAAAVGAAVALAVTRGAAVVGIWCATPSGPRAPATPAARRLSAKLTARGHDAAARGRLVVATLTDAAETARIAAATEVPVVLVVAGPRDAHVDRILRDHDHVVVAGSGLVADLAAASVRDLGVPAQTLALADALTARTLATAGVALVAPWRAPVEAALP